MRGSWHRLAWIARVLTFVLLLAPLPVLAQSDENAIGTVTIDGRTLFEVSGSSALPGDDRADNIAARIIAVAESSPDMSVDVTVDRSEFGDRILADGVEIMQVVEADALREVDGQTEIDIDLVANMYARNIQAAILDYRAARSEDARQRGLVEGLIWTLAFALFVVVLLWARNRVTRWVDRLVRRYMSAVEEATQEIVRARAIAEVVGVAAQGAFVALFFVALYYYVSVILFAFAETRGVAIILLNYVTQPILDAGWALLGFVPSLVVLLIIFLVTRYLIRIARVTFENIEAGTVRIKGFRKHWVWPSFNLVRAILIISAFILAYPYIPGSDSAAFQGMSILLGVMVSVGSNSVMSNMLAGLFVIYRQSTNVGDIIKIGDHIGEVVAIKLTESHLKSTKNEMISIPNAQLLNSEVINYSQKVDGKGMILHVEVGIGYDEPQQRIEALLIEAAHRTDAIKATPPPFVLRKELGDFTVTYEINGYSNRGDIRPKVLSDLRSNILDVFHAAGVQIMSPHYEDDPETPKVPEVPMPEPELEPEPGPVPDAQPATPGSGKAQPARKPA